MTSQPTIKPTRNGQNQMIVEVDGVRYNAIVTSTVKQFDEVPNVSDWIGVNIQCVPYQEIERRKKAGEPSLASIHDLAERSHTYYPASYARYETMTAKTVLDFLDPQPPGVTRTNGPVLRDFVNVGQLTEDGQYTGPGREQFLRDWLANGGRVTFVIAQQNNEMPDYPTINAGPAAVMASLYEIGPRACEGMRRLVRLIKRLNPAEQLQVLAVETMNEPAFYDKAGQKQFGITDWPAQQSLDLFEDDQAAIANAALEEGLPDHCLILMPRYKYNADAAALTNKNGRPNSILERWIDQFGNRIGISTHKYAPWISGQYTEEWLANAKADLGRIVGVPQVLTESNYSEFLTSERKSGLHHAGWVMAELSVSTGVPTQYFPGANWGDGALLSTRFTPDRCQEPDRLFMWYELVARTLRGTPLDVTLPVHLYRSNTDLKYVKDDQATSIKAGIRVVRLDGADYTFEMSGPEAIMCYGGAGGQIIVMNADEFSWFSGWEGDDVVDARNSPGCIINLGNGNDRVLLGGAMVTVHGRGGGDVFVLGNSGRAHVFGFNPAADKIKVDGVKYTIASEDFITIRTAGGGVVRLIGLVGSAQLAQVKAAIIP